MEHNESQIILYQTEDGATKVEVRMEGETVWLTQGQMAALFGKSVATINEHLKNIYTEKELEKSATISKFGISEFAKKPVYYYNLDVVISVGYRVKSLRGTQFRIWATKRLREYIVKGFTVDDERLSQGGTGSRYFKELLQRVRDIRASERNFYQKVTDIYTTAIDYRNDDALTQRFFATIQNKMHFAVHGRTAAELIAERADASRPNMGLTSFKGGYVTAADAHVAKNYLSEPELKQLSLIVSLYLDFAELQATNARPMRMEEWVSKLDEFLKLSEKGVLNDAGKVSAEKAGRIASEQYGKYRAGEEEKRISDFDQQMKRLEKKVKKNRKTAS